MGLVLTEYLFSFRLTYSSLYKTLRGLQIDLQPVLHKESITYRCSFAAHIVRIIRVPSICSHNPGPLKSLHKRSIWTVYNYRPTAFLRVHAPCPFRQSDWEKIVGEKVRREARQAWGSGEGTGEDTHGLQPSPIPPPPPPSTHTHTLTHSHYTTTSSYNTHSNKHNNTLHEDVGALLHMHISCFMCESMEVSATRVLTTITFFLFFCHRRRVNVKKVNSRRHIYYSIKLSLKGIWIYE